MVCPVKLGINLFHDYQFAVMVQLCRGLNIAAMAFSPLQDTLV